MKNKYLVKIIYYYEVEADSPAEAEKEAEKKLLFSFHHEAGQGGRIRA